MTIRELERYCLEEKSPVADALLYALDNDPRRGVRLIARTIRTQRERERREDDRLRTLLRYETDLWARGIGHVAGVDEAGVAPLAGPVVAAAVILPHDYRLRGLDDSKKIADPARREALARDLRRDAVCWAVARGEVEEIDRLNIYHASLLAMRRAVEGLRVRPGHLLVDARTIPHCGIPQSGIVHGDALSLSVAAASVLAKTARDSLMAALDAEYPGWDFAAHKGYPTPDHLATLRRCGALPIHRRSFEPVREVLGLDPVQRDLFERP